MAFAVQPETPPLRQDQAGAIRIGNSRVLLDLVIWAFQDGATPESIIQSYDTISLCDVYSVIAFYLRHREEVEEYLKERDQKADKVKKKIEDRQGDLGEIRSRLLARRRTRE